VAGGKYEENIPNLMKRGGRGVLNIYGKGRERRI